MDLDRVIIFTGDVRRMVDFYAAAFGMTMIGEFNPEWTEMASGRSNIAFHKFGSKGEARDRGDDGIKLVFGTTDVPGEKARLESLGIEMTKIFTFGDIQMCDGSDPDGRRFQISSRGR
ncbi:MAG: VOC family protein [Acidobacteria bacterium]|nr:VOC family protein [Acidobacteriota bacterium]